MNIAAHAPEFSKRLFHICSAWTDVTDPGASKLKDTEQPKYLHRNQT